MKESYDHNLAAFDPVVELLVALFVSPMLPDQDTFLLAVVALRGVDCFPETLVDDEKQEDDEDGQEIQHQGNDEETVFPPYIICCFVFVEKRLDQAQNTRDCFNVDENLDQLYIRGLGNLLVDGWDEGDEGKGQRCDSGDSARETAVLEENQQIYEAQHPQWKEDRNQVDTGVFVEWNSEVDILVVLDFLIRIFVCLGGGVQFKFIFAPIQRNHLPCIIEVFFLFGLFGLFVIVSISMKHGNGGERILLAVLVLTVEEVLGKGVVSKGAVFTMTDEHDLITPHTVEFDVNSLAVVLLGVENHRLHSDGEVEI